MPNYGPSLKPSQIRRLLKHQWEVNVLAEKNGSPQMPLCIWGEHGVGKTQLVEDFTREKAYEFCYLAPAQLDEMGDLLGLPALENGQTVLRPPAWSPSNPGPGILLIDDLNRADDRILRGLMQLLQRRALLSWQLPAGWQIVCTANPDNGDYSVTPLDEAMLSRLLHVTLRFDPQEWALWARKNGVHPTGIQFLLSRSEDAYKANPRAWTQFFAAYAQAPAGDLDLILYLAMGIVGEKAAADFIQFLRSGEDQVPAPEAILNALNFSGEILPALRVLQHDGVLKVDVLAALQQNLLSLVEEKGINVQQSENLINFLTLDFYPADLRFKLLRQLAALPSPGVQDFFQDPRVLDLL
jgi:AAA domain (dynein-related subfamily)